MLTLPLPLVLVADDPALRLWPPIASNARNASQDTVLPRGGGPDGRAPLFVPKGTECRFSTYSMQRRRDLYGQDADEFRPERWETLRVSYVDNLDWLLSPRNVRLLLTRVGTDLEPLHTAGNTSRSVEGRAPASASSLP